MRLGLYIKGQLRVVHASEFTVFTAFFVVKIEKGFKDFTHTPDVNPLHRAADWKVVLFTYRTSRY